MKQAYAEIDGYMHEHVASLTEDQERKILVRSIEAYKTFTGKYPKGELSSTVIHLVTNSERGFIAPNWAASSRTIRLLEEHHIEYDHSLFAHDFLPHWAFDMVEEATFADYSLEPETWMKPLRKIKPSKKVVEIPGGPLEGPEGRSNLFEQGNWDLT
jgi:peptidoglycan/xylan/chitin deacetylase (PgdA/CDA1 family)